MLRENAPTHIVVHLQPRFDHHDICHLEHLSMPKTCQDEWGLEASSGDAAERRRCGGGATEVRRKGDGSATEMRRSGGGATEVRRKCDGSATEMRRSGGGVTEVRRKCDGSATEMPRTGGGAAEVRRKCDGNKTPHKTTSKRKRNKSSTHIQCRQTRKMSPHTTTTFFHHPRPCHGSIAQTPKMHAPKHESQKPFPAVHRQCTPAKPLLIALNTCNVFC